MTDHLNLRARRVMESADQEARRLNHPLFGSEHILLGLLKEDAAVNRILRRYDVDFKRVKGEVMRLAPGLPHMVMMPRLPEAPSAERAFRRTLAEARRMEHLEVSAEHLLLALLEDREALASKVLSNLGVQVDQVRSELMSTLDKMPKGIASPAEARPSTSMSRTWRRFREWLWKLGVGS